MTLVGNRFVEASDPGAVGAGYQWMNSTTGDLYERDTTNASWTLIGNVNQANYGQLPLTGGNMSGAIAGVTGWAPNDSPNFTTVAKLLGVNLATVNDLADLETTLEALIVSKVDSAIASSSSSVSFGNNLVVATGKVGPATTPTGTMTIPAPVFPDGIAATADQCFVIASSWTISAASGGMTAIDVHNVGTSLEWMSKCSEAGGMDQAGSINYLVIAIR
jgi:hypothetical protein